MAEAASDAATQVDAVEVRMPQMGETVTEGTITAWLKSPGDAIAVDEPLLEISTDKVDSEIPSPVAGTVVEVLVDEGETVPIGELIARIATEGGAPPPDEPGPDTGEAAADEHARAEATAAPNPSPVPAEDPAAPAAPPVTHDLQPEATLRSGVEQQDQRSTTAAPAERQRSGVTTFLSPVVRKLVDEHDLDPSSIDGSGRDGRVTRDDVLAVVQAHPPSPERPGVRRIPFTAIRRTIARNLTASLATAAHTLVVVEVDYAAVAPVKEATGLTWLPFIARAAIDALRDFPLVNSHVAADALDVHDDVHLGMAVDLDFEGLVVPVLRNAGDLRLRALADALNQRATAAREHTLEADDYAGGTFTLTNAGRYGTLLTAPIINQPQAAILSTDGVKVRPVAVPLDDGGHGLAFHPVGNLALSFDHRAFDGAYASAFAARVRDDLEQRDWEEEAR